ncbi:antibiotic biosynthesis monooxygenase family protein [Microbacteriaceae bacterium 4G12]
MYIAVNTIEIAEPGRMKEMFKQTAPNLKHFEGFLGFELWETEGKMLAVSRWETKEQFEAYINSDMFKSHHGGESGAKMRPQAQVSYYNAEIFA